MPYSRKIRPKDKIVCVVSLQYQLRPSIENHCMGFFSEDGNWIISSPKSLRWRKRDLGGARWCCYWACETYKINEWILNLRHSCFSSSGLERRASVEEFGVAYLWLLFEYQGISYFIYWNPSLFLHFLPWTVRVLQKHTHYAALRYLVQLWVSLWVKWC